MPILPENKDRYPKNWKQISRDIRENRANNCCEFCGVKNYSVGYWNAGNFITLSSPPYNVPYFEDFTQYQQAQEIRNHYNDWCDQEPKAVIIVLTVAHLDHIPENCEPENLKALCQRCHNNYDKKHRKQTIRKRKFKGQLTLNIK